MGKAISHEEYEKALRGEWGVYLTPTKLVPRDWFGDLKGKKLFGLASGGGQQIPIFSALGAHCTVLDYSRCQCESSRVCGLCLSRPLSFFLIRCFLKLLFYQQFIVFKKNICTHPLLVAIGFCLMLSNSAEPYSQGFCGIDVLIWLRPDLSIDAEMV